MNSWLNIHLIEAFLLDKWRHYAYDFGEYTTSDRLWWFTLSSDANNRVVLFGLGPTLESARTRLEASLRVLYGMDLHLMEYASGLVGASPILFGPKCSEHSTHMIVVSRWFRGHLCFWRCGARGCFRRRFTVSLVPSYFISPGSAAGMGTAYDIAEGGKW